MLIFCLVLFFYFGVCDSINPKPTHKIKSTTYCVDCKYFIPGSSSQNGKCKLFLNLNEDLSTLINEETSQQMPTEEYINSQGYHYCFTARFSPNMCGKTGKCYSQKMK